MKFFICHDPCPRSEAYYFQIINIEKIVHASYSPSLANCYGEPLMTIKIATNEGYDCTTINGRDAYRLLQAMGLSDPPPPDEFNRYPIKRTIPPEPKPDKNDPDSIPF